VARQKVMQILVNLMRNATESLESSAAGERQLRVGLRVVGPERVRFEVQDNGAGITAENLTRIFGFGFTTKKDGHGFGLHSSAVSAREMGGTLTAESEGLNRGAKFVLELPFTVPVRSDKESPTDARSGAAQAERNVS
jgi:C4-dicarboxylate-specific signal transduction histidine kinase